MLEEYRRLKDLCSDISETQRGFRRFVKNNYATLQPLTHYDRVDEDGPYTGSRKVHNPGKEGYRYDVIHPSGRPCVQPARGYRFPPETMDKLLASGKVLFGDDETQIIQIKEYLKDYQGSLKGVLELDGRVGANAIESLFGSREVFKNPKPVELVSGLLAYVSSGNDCIADFFAGSGTTAQAVMQLNREDRAARRFLLADFGAYFDEILVERTMRVMYWPTWKQGKPVVVDAEERGWIEWSPRLLKILRLESFEDSLNALELPEERDARLAGQQEIFGDDYLLKYMLDFETEDSRVRLNTQALEHPFDYKLRIHGNDGLVEVPVDLVETFNLLMGLHVQRIHALADGKRAYRVVEALEDGRPVLVAWRDMAGFDPERDRAFLEGRFDLPAFAVVYVNGDSSIPNGRSLDGEFHRRMNERDEHFLQ
jgi:adenine-specific DNA-methyltransferase